MSHSVYKERIRHLGDCHLGTVIYYTAVIANCHTLNGVSFAWQFDSYKLSSLIIVLKCFTKFLEYVVRARTAVALFGR